MTSSAPTAEFFVSNEKVQTAWEDARKPLPSAGVQSFDDAILLPLRRKDTPDKLHYYYEGGLCDKDGVFLAGRRRSLDDDMANLSMLWSYPVPPGEIEDRDEEVIFGGVIFSHWGHLITDSTARLWYVTARPGDKRKIVLLERPGNKAQWASEDWKPLFALAGIDAARVEIVSRPTRFRRVVVPDEAYYPFSGFRPEWPTFFEAVRSRITPSPHRKVYFSRTRCTRNDTFNEDLFEDYYREQGFHVVHPEDCTLDEELSCAAGADEVVATVGTLSHNFIFCKPGTKATVLLRTPTIIQPQLLIGAACGLRCSYVEAAANVLPAHHSNCVYYLVPTLRFRKHLAANGLPPFGKSRCDAVFLPDRVRPYVRQWFETFAERRGVFAKSSSPDVVARAGLADAYGSADPDAREKLVEGVASFVAAELRRKDEPAALKKKLKACSGTSGRTPFRFDPLYPLRLAWRPVRRRLLLWRNRTAPK